MYLKEKLVKKRIWLAIPCLLFCYYLYDMVTGDFSVSNISYNFYSSKEEPSPISDEEHEVIKNILNQSFSYLSNGNQTYVFLSQDRKYVLKFFRFKHLKDSLFLNWLPSIAPIVEYRHRKMVSQKRKLERIFNSFEIAYDLDKDNTGLVFNHLYATKNLNKKLQVVDRIGFSHTIDLDKTTFVIQEKGITTGNVIKNLLSQGDVENTKKKFRLLFDMYVSEYERGLLDDDHNIMHNTGFINDKPFRLDTGKIHKTEQIKNPSIYLKDLRKIATRRIDKWLQAYFPQYRLEIFDDLQRKLDEISLQA